MYISWGTAFQEEETVSANTLRQECAWHVRGVIAVLAGAECSRQGGKGTQIKKFAARG